MNDELSITNVPVIAMNEAIPGAGDGIRWRGLAVRANRYPAKWHGLQARSGGDTGRHCEERSNPIVHRRLLHYVRNDGERQSQ
jgi:hypothetical protein